MAISTFFKRLLYPIYILPKVTSKTKSFLQQIFSEINTTKLLYKKDLKIFSTREEDGIILNLIAMLDIKKGYFLDIGSNDCINSNFANLAFNFDWNGVFIDADKNLLRVGEFNYFLFGKKNNVKFVCTFLYPENINEVIIKNCETFEIDFMNIDIDGNDYAIWEAINCVQPKIVVVENKIEYGKTDIVVPNTQVFNQEEWGASIVSFTRLAAEKNYSLVATIQEGFNAFYMRNDLVQQFNIPLLSLTDTLEKDTIKSSFYSKEKMQDLISRI